MQTSFLMRCLSTLFAVCLACCDSALADNLVAVERDQKLSTSVVLGEDSDKDRERDHIGNFTGVEMTNSRSQVECLEASSQLGTLVQFDVARINLGLSIAACDGLPANNVGTASGESEVVIRIERDARKIVAVSNDSTQSISGAASITRVGDASPLWSLDLEDASNNFQSAFALELFEGDYQLELSASHTGNATAESNLRLSLVNRGDISGNEKFDAADLAVLSAILNQPTYSVAADLDDDGDNDERDRRLWMNGLGEGAFGAAVSDDLLSDDTFLPEPQFPDPTPILPPTSEELPVSVPTGEYSPSDLDRNGTVEFGDFLLLRRNFGKTVVNDAPGDIDGDGLVGFGDFLAFSKGYGQPLSSASVPEPDSQLLAVLLASCLVMVGRRRHQHTASSTPASD